jgi:hypothetical protein
MPWHLFWAYFTAFAFIAAAAAIAAKRMTVLASGLLGFMFFLWVVTLHAPRVAAAVHNGDEWNSLFMCLAMSGFAFILAGSFNPALAESPAAEEAEPVKSQPPRLLRPSTADAPHVFPSGPRVAQTREIRDKRRGSA